MSSFFFYISRFPPTLSLLFFFFFFLPSLDLVPFPQRDWQTCFQDFQENSLLSKSSLKNTAGGTKTAFYFVSRFFFSFFFRCFNPAFWIYSFKYIRFFNIFFQIYMSLWMYSFKYIYIYIFLWIYSFKYIYIYIYIYISLNIFFQIYIYIYIYIYISLNIFFQIYIYIFLWIYSFKYVTYSYACRNIVNTIMMNKTQFFRKIYLSHFIRNGTKRLWKGYVWEVNWRLNKTATYWPPALLAITALLSRSPGLINWGPWGPSLHWDLVLTLASYLKNSDSNQLELPVAPGYIIVWHPPASVSVASALNPTRPQSRLSPDIFDAPVIYTDAFLIWQLGWVGGQYVTNIYVSLDIFFRIYIYIYIFGYILSNIYIFL